MLTCWAGFAALAGVVWVLMVPLRANR